MKSLLVLLQISCWVQQWKNSENRSLFDEVIRLWNSAAYFHGPPVHATQQVRRKTYTVIFPTADYHRTLAGINVALWHSHVCARVCVINLSRIVTRQRNVWGSKLRPFDPLRPVSTTAAQRSTAQRSRSGNTLLGPINSTTRTPATDTTNEHHQRTSSQQFYNKFATSQCQSLTSRHVKMLGCGQFLSVGGVRSRCPCSGVWALHHNTTQFRSAAVPVQFVARPGWPATVFLCGSI